MEIDGDTGRYGSMVILSKLNSDPKKAVEEILDTFETAVGENLMDFLYTEEADNPDEIQQSRELSLHVDLTDVKNSDFVINALADHHLGTFEGMLSPRGKDKQVQFMADIFLRLLYVDEYEDDDGDDEEEPVLQKEARFNTSIIVK